MKNKSKNISAKSNARRQKLSINCRLWKLLGTSSVRFRVRERRKAGMADKECHIEYREKIQLLES